MRLAAICGICRFASRLGFRQDLSIDPSSDDAKSYVSLIQKLKDVSDSLYYPEARGPIVVPFGVHI